MNDDNEIEKMARLMGMTDSDIGEIAEILYKQIAKKLINAGIGDKRQAVKEAFDKLSKKLTDQAHSIYYNDVNMNLVEIEDALQTIDTLFIKLYGEENRND